MIYGVIYEGQLNGKLYIGQHVGTDVEDTRWKEHLYPSSKCRYFRNAIQAHGRDNVKWSIVCYCISGGQERLDELEIYFIEERNSLAPNGYNLQKGGRGGVPSKESRRLMSDAWTKERREQHSASQSGENHHNFGKKASEETKAKMSKAHSGEKNHRFGKSMKDTTKELLRMVNTGKKASEETKARMSAARTGEKNPNYGLIGKANPLFGRTRSDKTRAKISQAQKGIPKSETQADKTRKKVLQYTMDGMFIREWNGIAVAQRATGTHHISGVCNGDRKQSGGYIWRLKFYPLILIST